MPRTLVVGALLALSTSIFPLGYLAIRATGDGWGTFTQLLLRRQVLELVLRSASLAVVVTGACLGISVAAAYTVTRLKAPLRGALTVGFALPLAIPTYVAAYAWLSTFRDFDGFWGAATVLTLCSYPYAYLPIVAAMRRADPAQAEVARTLGLSPARAFWSVTIRQIRPSITAGGLLVCLYVLSDFGAVSIMRYDALTRSIYSSYRSSFDRTPAAVLGCVLVALTLAVLALESRARGRRAMQSVVATRPRPSSGVRWNAWSYAIATGSVVSLLVAIGVPATSVIYWLTKGQSSSSWNDVWTSAGSTMWVAILAAGVTAILALPIAILAARHSQHRSARTFERLSHIGHALPGLVIALALVFFGIRFAPSLYQRTPLLVVAYVALFLPLAVGAMTTSIAQASPALEEVARSLGESPIGSFRRVTLPLAAPGIGAGAALVALACVKELPATLLLRPTEVNTLATELWASTETASYAAAAPYAALLIAVAAIPTFLLTRNSGVMEGGTA